MFCGINCWQNQSFMPNFYFCPVVPIGCRNYKNKKSSTTKEVTGTQEVGVMALSEIIKRTTRIAMAMSG
jgi:hypothetical protein